MFGNFIKKPARKIRPPAQTAVAQLESLEPRLLLSLLGVEIEAPGVNYDATGHVGYDSVAQTFDSDATPLSIQFTAGSRPIRITTPRDFQLHILVDNAGDVAGGAAGDDLLVVGSIDINRDRIPDYDGVLLTGEIQQFGYLDAGTSTDQYDFRFTPTGGDLMPFFEGKDIGVRMTSTNSDFAGVFTADFSGGAQGVVGPIEQLAPPPGASLAGRVYVDANNNGADDGEAAISNVIVTVTGTDVDGNDVNLATISGEDGTYSFDDLRPGTYTLTETQPFDYLDGLDSAGNLGGTAGDDVISFIVAGSGDVGVDYNFGELAPASIAGSVLVDGAGIAEVTVTLSGTDDLGGAVSVSQQTAADGSFLFEGLRPGTYAVSETQPIDYIDGDDAAGSLGGAVADDVISDIAVASGDAGVGYTFIELNPSSLSGFVWEDFNNDGEIDFNELAIENVTVTLTGTDDRGDAVTQVVQTDADGVYAFTDLRPGTYAINETQPAGYIDGLDVLGVDSIGGTIGNDVFSDISVTAGVDGTNYNFGERPEAGSSVVQGQTATIGFWQNKNGQKLLTAVNGSADATQMGNWLAATFPNLYGSGDVDLAGMTNAEVAAFYRARFKAKVKKKDSVGGPRKVDCQVMATAFAVYVTNSNLAGNAAESFGFIVDNSGVGVATFNVGDCGDAFGVADNTEMTVLDMLLATDSMSVDGQLYDLDVYLRTLANQIYSAINESGDI